MLNVGSNTTYNDDHNPSLAITSDAEEVAGMVDSTKLTLTMVDQVGLRNLFSREEIKVFQINRINTSMANP